VDTLGHREGKVVGAYPCHGHGVNQVSLSLSLSYSLSLSHMIICSSSVQEFHYTDLDQIVYEDDLCLDVPRSKLKNPVEIQICHFMGGNQKWKYDNQVRSKELTAQCNVQPIAYSCMRGKECDAVQLS
jgi:hypothetical protein